MGRTGVWRVRWIATLALLAWPPASPAAASTDDMRPHYQAVQSGTAGAETVRAIRRSMAAGDPQAVEVLAWMHVHGRGVPRHLCTALALYLRADELGVAKARANAVAVQQRLRAPCRIARRLAGRLIAPAAPPARVPKELARLLDETGRRVGLEPALLYAVAQVESGFRPRVVSSAGARGVMQIMPATAREVFGVDPARLFDAQTNIALGGRFLADLIARYGALDPALSHYYSGRAVETPSGWAPHPIARDYVARVRAALAAHRAAGR
jgi:hypothetical protein